MERLWRCDTCGKWSHAVRKPTKHIRIVRDEPDDEAIIVSYDPGVPPGDFNTEFPESWEVRCGPFSAWTATRDGAA